MKKMLLLMMGFAAISSKLLTAAPLNHLLPVDLPDQNEKNYRAYLHKRLCPTAFDCGRYLVMPPFQKSEISVSLYSHRDTAGSTKCYVTSVEPTDNLRDWSEGGKFLNRANRLRVRRTDAELPASTCMTLKEIWTKMLPGHKPSVIAGKRSTNKSTSNNEPETERVYMDATMGEFAIKLASGKTLTGETMLVPDLGKNIESLIEIGDTLIEYCKAPISNRPAIVGRIDARAKKLLSRLKTKE